MSLALLICGLDGYLFAYDAGACANYSQWLRADRGDKPERTTLSAPGATSLLYLLETIAAGRAAGRSRCSRPTISWKAISFAPDARRLYCSVHSANHQGMGAGALI